MRLFWQFSNTVDKCRLTSWKSFTSKVIFCQWKLLDDDWQVSLDLLLITSVRIYFQEGRIIVGSKNAFPHIDNLVTCEIVTFQDIQEALKIQLDSKIKVYWHSIKICGFHYYTKKYFCVSGSDAAMRPNAIVRSAAARRAGQEVTSHHLLILILLTEIMIIINVSSGYDLLWF